MAKKDKNLKGVLHSYAIPRFLFGYARRRKRANGFGAEILTCQDCGLTITIYRTETEVDGMTSVTVRYVITYGGEEIYSTEETY